MFQNLEKVATHQNLAAAESEEKSPSLGQLLQNIFDLGGGHLAVIIVIQIAMNAAFVTAIRDVEMDPQGNSQFEGALVHLLHQAHAASTGPADISKG